MSKFYVSKSSDGWAVKKEGSSKASSIHSTQSDAWAEGRRLARGSGGTSFLKGRDGRITASNTYKNDPTPTKG